MWYLKQDVKAELERHKSFAITDAQAEQFGIAVNAEESILSVENGIGYIPVKGVLSKQVNILAMLFGGGSSSYVEIIEAIKEADGNPNVFEIKLLIDSPGGNVSGMFDLFEAINQSKTVVNCLVDGMACSAAYGIASQCNRIEATNEACNFGSVGVMASVHVDDDDVVITSTNAPNKSPDVTTEEGKNVVRSELDQYEELFIDRIAKGRNVSPDTVKETYGRGGTFLAQEALNRGMIDKITPLQTTANSGKEEYSLMNLDELKATHADVYAQAVADGVEKERKRVEMHLNLGKATGASELALENIVAGVGYTDEVRAGYDLARFSATKAQAMESDLEADNQATKADSVPVATKAPETDEEYTAKLVAKVLQKGEC